MPNSRFSLSEASSLNAWICASVPTADKIALSQVYQILGDVCDPKLFHRIELLDRAANLHGIQEERVLLWLLGACFGYEDANLCMHATSEIVQARGVRRIHVQALTSIQTRQHLAQAIC